MHHLDGDLAQRIVEHSMSVVDRNVNAMDAAGVTVGSGDPERVGRVLEGALPAVTQGREVMIDEATAAALQGVRPGVNLPLRWRDEVTWGIGIFMPFLVAAALESAQGSSTVALVTTSLLIAPLMGSLGLDSELLAVIRL